MQLYSHYIVAAVFLSCILLLLETDFAYPYPFHFNDQLLEYALQDYEPQESQVESLPADAKIAADCPLDPSISIPTIEPMPTGDEYHTCAAFVADVTGSMVEEIGGIKRVLADFLSTQLELSDNIEYCYMLVPVVGRGESELQRTNLKHL